MDKKLKQRLDKIQIELAEIPGGNLEAYWESNGGHSYSARLDAHHSASTFLMFGNSCSKTDLIVLSGRDTTDSTGQAKILIDPLLCGVTREGLPSYDRLVMVREPHFVATAHESAPVFITVQTSSKLQGPQANTLIVDRGGNIVDQSPIIDVAVNITSWKHDGSPAATTTFAWICTIEAARSFSFG